MTNIEWTHPPGYRGESWNPVTGCTKVSAGCRNCYAEGVAERFWARQYPQSPPRKFTDVRTHVDRLDLPLRRRAPTCWFVNSMSDLFHEAVPDEFVRAVWATMAAATHHRFIVLTKRPARMLAVLTGWQSDGLTLREGCGAVLPNVWLGVSCEDQLTADERIPLLLQTPAAVRLVSLEPLLGRVALRNAWVTDIATEMWQQGDPLAATLMRQSVADGSGWMAPTLDWLIVGGESGPGARVCGVDWIRSIVRQGQAAGVPTFVKQLGAQVMEEFAPGCDRLITFRDRKGSDPSEWPADMRAREWPTTEEAGR